MCLIKPRREGETDTRLAPKAKQPLEWMLQVRTYFFSKLNRVILLLKIPWHDEKESRLLQPNFPIFLSRINISILSFQVTFGKHANQQVVPILCRYQSQMKSPIHHQCLSPLITHHTRFGICGERISTQLGKSQYVLASIQMDIEYLTFEARLLSFLHSF